MLDKQLDAGMDLDVSEVEDNHGIGVGVWVAIIDLFLQ